MAVAPRQFYDDVADAAARVVIRRYSTSFRLAARLLGSEIRQHVENIYALVRIADEVVDGAASAARVDPDGVALQLAILEEECHRAMDCGYSTNLVVHAFARTSRIAGFGAELTTPFFASMRADLSPRNFTQPEFERYIYGSAEVVGLMCLRVFLHQEPDLEVRYAQLEDGARRLGAAFQKINFLRDLGADFHDLHRSYFPGVEPASLTEVQKAAIVTDIETDLAASARALQELPASSWRAVAVAHGLFTELTARARHTPAELLLASRIRVPNAVKARIAAGAVLAQRTRSRAPHLQPQGAQK